MCVSVIANGSLHLFFGKRGENKANYKFDRRRRQTLPSKGKSNRIVSIMVNDTQ